MYPATEKVGKEPPASALPGSSPGPAPSLPPQWQESTASQSMLTQRTPSRSRRSHLHRVFIPPSDH